MGWDGVGWRRNGEGMGQEGGQIGAGNWEASVAEAHTDILIL